MCFWGNDSRSEGHSVNRWWSDGNCAVSAYSENFEVWGEVRLGRRGFGANTYTAVVGVDCVVRTCACADPKGEVADETGRVDAGRWWKAAASGGHWRKRAGLMDLWICAVRGECVRVGLQGHQVFIRQRGGESCRSSQCTGGQCEGSTPTRCFPVGACACAVAFNFT